MLSPIPRRNQWVPVSLIFPIGGSLLHFLAGSASASPISVPAQRSIVTACKLAESLNDPLHRRLRRSRHLLRRYNQLGVPAQARSLAEFIVHGTFLVAPICRTAQHYGLAGFGT